MSRTLAAVAEKLQVNLIGEDARVLDELVREAPEDAYEPVFMEKLLAKTEWELGS